MRPIGDGTLQGAMTLKASQRSLPNLSKELAYGDYRLFFPLMKTADGGKSIIAPTGFGRALDKDALRKFFVPIEEFEQAPSGKIIDKSGLSKYAEVAWVLFQAEEAYEEERAKKEAKEVAESQGKPVDEVALALKLKEIRDTYFGDMDAKPNPVYATKAPVISGQKLLTVTELVVVPMNSQGMPEVEKIEVKSLELNKKKFGQLLDVLGKVEFTYHPDFLEVAYNYTGSSKQEAGQKASFNGVAESLSLKTKCGADWAVLEGKIKGMLMFDQQGIMNRNASLASPVTPKEVEASFLKWASTKPILAKYINTEEERVQRAAKDLLEMGIVVNTSETGKKLAEIIAEQEAKQATAETKDEQDAINYSTATEAQKADTLAALNAVEGIEDAMAVADSEIADI